MNLMMFLDEFDDVCIYDEYIYDDVCIYDEWFYPSESSDNRVGRENRCVLEGKKGKRKKEKKKK
jgi:hypothetical protein